MKAADFEYVRPASLDAALRTLADHDGEARPLAGGQSLMPMMNFRLAQPDLLVDLNALDELKGISEQDASIVIGAMSTYRELQQSPLVKTHLPLFNLALPHIAHAAIRNRGTIGGSVSLADPAAEMPALLLVLNANIVAISTAGERSIPASEFFLGLYETALHEGEIVKAIIVPKVLPGERFAFQEIARRHGDYAMAGVALGAVDCNPVSGLRISFFSVSDRALRATGAENALTGHGPSDKIAMTVALETLTALEIQGDLNASESTKRHLAGVMLKRAFEELRS